MTLSVFVAAKIPAKLLNHQNNKFYLLGDAAHDAYDWRAFRCAADLRVFKLRSPGHAIHLAAAAAAAEVERRALRCSQ